MRLRSLALFRYWHTRRKNFSAQRQLRATHQSFISHLAITVLRGFQLHTVSATQTEVLIRGLGRNVHPSWFNNSLLGPLLGGFNHKRTAPSFARCTRIFLQVMPRLCSLAHYLLRRPCSTGMDLFATCCASCSNKMDFPCRASCLITGRMDFLPHAAPPAQSGWTFLLHAR